MPLDSYRDLKVWQRAIELVKEIYKITNELPKAEMYGLSSQMRDAVVSIPSNVAEGYRRRGLGDYLRFLGIADGSAAELDTQLVIIVDIYPRIDISRANQLLGEVQRMLFAMIQKIQLKQS